MQIGGKDLHTRNLALTDKMGEHFVGHDDDNHLNNLVECDENIIIQGWIHVIYNNYWHVEFIAA